jgi:diphthamide biosynthesis enzyme Dph1/Dph2-like protein
MKSIFIPVEVTFSANFEKLKKDFMILPKNLAIVYSIQYKSFAEKIKDELSKKHIVTNFFQILGCSNPSNLKKADCILIVGDGKFHAISLAYETKKQVYLLERDKLIKIMQEEVAILEKKRKIAYFNFLNSKKAGVLISTKPGQQRLEKALNLKKKLRDKKLYFFISNEINFKETENFGLNFWINTSCPRMDLDNPKIININKL